MTTRKTYSPNQNLVLFNEVDGICPLCKTILMYEKAGKKHKLYELAHIYPLNPSYEEIELLKDEERLSNDVNDIANIIALCELCHTKFDKPRTVEEYRNLVALKKKARKRTAQSAMWHEYGLMEEISMIIDSIKLDTDSQETVDIEFSAKRLSEKLDETMSPLTVRKIRSNVDDYFSFIRSKFLALEEADPGSADIIAQQIKLFYTKQKSISSNQQEIYNNIVAWLQAQTDEDHPDAVDIVASFFVQNCEVF